MAWSTGAPGKLCSTSRAIISPEERTYGESKAGMAGQRGPSGELAEASRSPG